MFYFVTQGLFERSDSIGQDLANQVRALSAAGIKSRVFAGNHRPSLYPDFAVENIERLSNVLASSPAPIIYHWCDGWPELDNFLKKLRKPVILRWHNNTPPWFFPSYSFELTARTLNGFISVLEMIKSPHVSFMVNSDYSARQLEVLGVSRKRISVVYPVSDYLSSTGFSVRDETGPSGSLRILFVGRIVSNKGHLHILKTAEVLRDRFGVQPVLMFPGRTDSALAKYVSEIKTRARNLKLELHMPGEITQENLKRTFQRADVFLCLSEHEGFGLPVIEAMRSGLPVVGYRSSAIAETLQDHPLAFDELDYTDIASRLFCLTDPAIGKAISQYQAECILPRFSSVRVNRDLFSALSIDAPAGFTETLNSPDGNLKAHTLQIVQAALADAKRKVKRLDARVAEPVDPPNRMVTISDIRSFQAMLARSSDSAAVRDFRDECMAIPFNSPLPIIGGLVNRFKRFVLFSQDGLVTTVAKSNTRLATRIEQLESTSSQSTRGLTTRIERLERKVEKYLARPVAEDCNEKSLEEIFTDIYERNLWGGNPGEYFSGSGSDESVARPYAKAVNDFIRQLAIRSVVDLGCGDFRVGSLVNSPDIDYLGVDVVPALIDRNEALYGSSQVAFECLDIVNDELPDADLCLVRQVLQHLSNRQITILLSKLEKYRYVLITEHYPAPELYQGPNEDMVPGSDTRILKGSAVVVDAPPFGLAVKRTLLAIELPHHLVSAGETLRTLVLEHPRLSTVPSHRASIASNGGYPALSKASKLGQDRQFT
jgi:glycosyltransferase involved in cell wall biosynthesis